MKLILTQEVTGVGAPGDVIEVKDGYGRNYLVPQGLAITATRGQEKQIATIRRAREVREVRDLGQARELASQLQGLSIRLATRVGRGGRLFGSVTAADVVAAVTQAGGPRLDRRRIELTHAIKTAGTHDVSVHLHSDIAANLSVEVVAV